MDLPKNTAKSQKSNVTEARPGRRRSNRHSRNSDSSRESHRNSTAKDHPDIIAANDTENPRTYNGVYKRPMRTESGDSYFILAGEDDKMAIANWKTSKKANVVESKRSRHRRASNPVQAAATGRLSSDSDISPHQSEGIGMIPMDTQGTLKTAHSRHTNTYNSLDREDRSAPRKPPLPIRSRTTSTPVSQPGGAIGSRDSASPGARSMGDSSEEDKIATTERALPRPTSSGRVPKPRPISLRKHHSKPPLPPPGPNRRSPNRRGPNNPTPLVKEKAAQAAGGSARNMVSSNSFLSSSIFSMSFLLAKPPAPANSETQEEEKLTSTPLDTERYPTNESSLPRLASFYGALKASADHISSLNTRLHPAAAGASFIIPARPRARMLSPSDKHGHVAVGDLLQPSDGGCMNRQYSSVEEVFDADFPPDCGPTLDDKILSYQYAMRVAAFNHAGSIDSDGITLKPHPLDADFGWFALPLMLFGDEKPASSVLEKYGIGITLWFKFLKAFGVILFVMFLLTLPSMILYLHGTEYNSTERLFSLQSSPTDLLFATTLGNIAEAGSLCFAVEPNEQVVLNCGKSRIEAVSVYYGQPTGSCHCPSVQQPLRSGSCPGNIRTKSGKGECSRDMNGNFEACFYSEMHKHHDEPQPCCAFELRDDGTPDLSALNIRPDITCNSLTAQYIAEGVCNGKSSCTLVADAAFEYSWTGDDIDEVPTGVCATLTTLDGSGYQCNTTMGYAGSWESCGGPGSGRIMVQAVCSADDIHITGFSISKAEVVLLSSILNAVAMVVFIFGIYWVAYQQRKEEVFMNRNRCRANDYTIRLDVIPDHTSTHVLAKKLKRHFEKTLTACKPCFLPGVVRIADINFTTGGYNALQAAIKRGQAARLLDSLLYKKKNMETLGLHSTCAYKLVLERERRAVKAYDEWNEICVKESDVGNNGAHKVKRSYITFESEEGYLRCLKYYHHAFASFFDREDLRLDGKRLKVHPAEDPSDILWENLGTPTSQQLLGRMFTALLMFALLAATYFVVDNAIRAGRVNEEDFPSVVDCDDYRVSLVKSDGSSLASTITYQRTLHDVNWQYYNNTLGRQGYLQCYCKELFQDRGLQRMMAYDFFNEQDQKDEKWCKDVVLGFVNLAIVRMVVAIVVVTVNISAKSILRALQDVERRGSQTEISESMTFKLFVVQAVNTGLIVLLMNGRASGFDQTSITFLNGKYSDFSSGWYEDVGISIMGTMTLYMFGVHGLKLFNVLSSKFLRWQDKHFSSDTRLTNQVSQEQLNRLYLGPEFVIEVRYATALTICFVCVPFASAMPLMYLISAIGFALLYIVDKYYFLRVSRIPRAVSPSLAHSVTKSFYIAACLNLAIAVWAFSNTLLFAPTVQKIRTTQEYGGLEFVNVKFEYYGHRHMRFRLFNNFTALSWIVLFPLAVLMIVIYSGDVLRIVLYVVEKIWPSFGMNIAERPYQGNPEYFDSVPLPVLKRRVGDGIVKKHIYDRYKKRIKELEANNMENRQLEGLESYDISLNEIYADKLAINTDYIALKRPPDLFKDDAKVLDYVADEENMVKTQPHKVDAVDSDSQGKSARRSCGMADGHHQRRSGMSSKGSSRNGNGKRSGQGTGSSDSGSSKHTSQPERSAGGEKRKGSPPANTAQLLSGQSSSFATMEADSVEEIRDVTQLFF